MPYIKQHSRELIQNGHRPNNAGELNYLITTIILDYLNHKGQSYQTCNDIIGVLEGSKLEFYRRFLAHYEDTKIVENGDLY